MPQSDKVDIDDIQEVINAISCASPQGPYFKVGGEYIHPEEIVSFEGPEETAKFNLVDGRTLQHNRFEDEESGDILYRALRVMRRPRGKSQTVKPVANRGLDLSSGGDVVSVKLDTSTITNFGPGTEARFNIENEIVVKRHNSNEDVTLLNYRDGSSIVTQKTQYTGTTQYGVDISDAKGYGLFGDAGSNAEIVVVKKDGTSSSVAASTNTFGLSNIGGAAFAAGKTIGSNGFAYFACDTGNSELGRLPLDGSTTASKFNNVDLDPGGRLAIDEDDEEVYFLKNSTVKKVDATDLSASSDNVVDLGDLIGTGGYVLQRYDDNLVVTDQNDDIYIIDTGQGKVAKKATGFNDPQDAGLDLSVL